MVAVDHFLAILALSLGTLACPLEPHGLSRRDDTNSSSSSIPAATTWSPPSSMTVALDQVWNETLKENPGWSDDKNWIFDQLIANNGSINYCVRWNTAQTSTARNRTLTASALQRSLGKWVDTLVGFEGFPLSSVNVTVVGYAVKDKSLLEGDVSDIDVYTTTDTDGVPECDTRCYRGAHLDGNISSCPGGKASRYDISLWLDDSLTGETAGYGYNWGEELPPDYFFSMYEDDNVQILLHEMGHGFGLLDFYTWIPQGQENFIMRAGSAMKITEFDAWMLRDWWRRLKAVRNW